MDQRLQFILNFVFDEHAGAVFSPLTATICLFILRIWTHHTLPDYFDMPYGLEKLAALLPREIPEGVDFAASAMKEVFPALTGGARAVGERVAMAGSRTEAVEAFTQENPAGLVLSDLKRIGGSLSPDSNGALYATEQGRKYYVKFSRSTGGLLRTKHFVDNELLGLELYRIAGATVPDGVRVLDPTNGRYGIASAFIDNLQRLPKLESFRNPSKFEAELRKIQGLYDGFPADAWLANWDNVGRYGDNIKVQIGTSGLSRAIRIEAGGVLKYRGLDTLSDYKLTPVVDEFVTLRDPCINFNSASIFNPRNRSRERLSTSARGFEDGIRRVATISDESIGQAVEKFGPGNATEKQELADTLIARRNDLSARVAR